MHVYVCVCFVEDNARAMSQTQVLMLRIAPVPVPAHRPHFTTPELFVLTDGEWRSLSRGMDCGTKLLKWNVVLLGAS